MHNDNDLFNFSIAYNNPTHGGTALYNGNIAETEWMTANDDLERWYTYGYDALNRITSATGNTDKFNLTNVAYDKMGNITNLERRGAIVAMPSIATDSDFGIMDKLTYAYDSGNKLLSVTEGTTGNIDYGFKDGNTSGNDYAYDNNGNLIEDKNKGISSVEYNHLNLPVQVSFNSGGLINYVYDATGNKLEKTASNGTYTEYAGNYVYEGGNLQFFNHTEGYVDVDNGNYSYVHRYKDHLGNVRLSYTDTDGNGSIDPATEIIKETNYYPFGLEHKGYNNAINGVENNYYTYQGKELDESLGLDWHDFGARMYDAAIGRWTTMDPLAEEFTEWSPYNAMMDNPIKYIDPDGMAPFDWFKNQEGKVVWFDNTSENFTSENGDQWQNVGANLTEVKENLNVPDDQTFEWKDAEAVVLGGAQGNGKGMLAPVVLESTAQVSFDLNVENAGTSGLERIDGETEITGVNVNVTMSTGTSQPIDITGIGGSFGLQQWTALGKRNVSDSGSFESVPTLSNLQSHSSGAASLTIGLKTFNRVNRNQFGGSSRFDLGIRSTATFRLPQNGRKGFFSTSNTVTIKK